MSERIHLVQSSMQHSDIAADVGVDAINAYATDGDVVAFSEASRFPVDHLITREARKAGYTLWLPKMGDVALAVHPRNDVLDCGLLHVLPSKGGMPKGNYAARPLIWVTIKTSKGNVATVHTTHWITGYKLGPAGNKARERDFEKQTAAMIDKVKEQGKGRHLSFWTGDTNIDEAKDRGVDPDAIHHQFRNAGLISVYDELGQYPDTHGNKTLDIIGSYAPDGRVSAHAVHVYARRHSDHRMVSAWYDIR